MNQSSWKLKCMQRYAQASLQLVSIGSSLFLVGSQTHLIGSNWFQFVFSWASLVLIKFQTHLISAGSMQMWRLPLFPITPPEDIKNSPINIQDIFETSKMPTWFNQQQFYCTAAELLWLLLHLLIWVPAVKLVSPRISGPMMPMMLSQLEKFQPIFNLLAPTGALYVMIRHKRRYSN